MVLSLIVGYAATMLNNDLCIICERASFLRRKKCKAEADSCYTPVSISIMKLQNIYTEHTVYVKFTFHSTMQQTLY